MWNQLHILGQIICGLTGSSADCCKMENDQAPRLKPLVLSFKDDIKPTPSSASNLSSTVIHIKQENDKSAKTKRKNVFAYEQSPEILFATNKKNAMATVKYDMDASTKPFSTHFKVIILFFFAWKKIGLKSIWLLKSCWYCNCSVLQQYLKNEAKQSINFCYDLEKYDQKKIKNVITKVWQKNEDTPACSMQHAVACLKSLFEECTKDSFQVSCIKYYL